MWEMATRSKLVKHCNTNDSKNQTTMRSKSVKLKAPKKSKKRLTTTKSKFLNPKALKIEYCTQRTQEKILACVTGEEVRCRPGR